MPKQVRNEGLCITGKCPNQQFNKGLCYGCYRHHKDGKFLYDNEIRYWELGRHHTKVIGYFSYLENLKSILRGVNVSKETRSKFNRVMKDAYATANPEQMRGAAEK